jgi:hypothetical protein
MVALYGLILRWNNQKGMANSCGAKPHPLPLSVAERGAPKIEAKIAT